jgi:DNA polymerase
MTTRIHLDFETRSEIDLRDVGAYTYSEHKTTDALCASFAIEGGDIHKWLRHMPFPAELARVMKAGDFRIVGHNVTFEHCIWNNVMLRLYSWPELKIEETECTMATAYYNGLPGSLEDVALALCVTQEKDIEGRKLMLKMCKPRRHKKGESKWLEDAASIARLSDYCDQDVRTERAVDDVMDPLPPVERKLWVMDQHINNRGVHVDRFACMHALGKIEKIKVDLDARMAKITNNAVGSVASVGQLGDWIRSKGVPIKGVANADVLEAMTREDLPAKVRAALLLRQQGAKSSTAKIGKMLSSASKKDRARGMFQYYGASTTGRWAGRLIQLHNLPRPTLTQEQIEALIATLGKDLSYPEWVKMCEKEYGPPMVALSSCLRGLLTSNPAKPKKLLQASDFSNVEGRFLAWLAGFESKLQAYRDYDNGDGPDLYLVSAAAIYNCTIEEAAEHRQIGKVAELALGFQGGENAFVTMGENYGVEVTSAEAKTIKINWRDANVPIVELWQEYDDAAMAAVKYPGKVVKAGKCKFVVSGRALLIKLPSGRMLHYMYPKIVKTTTPWGAVRSAVSYMTQVDKTNKRAVVPDAMSFGRWQRVTTFGGKIAENITQAGARDLLASSMLRVDAAGMPIVMHVHDEVVTELEPGTLQLLRDIMNVVPAWAPGLPLATSGWEGQRYRK